MKKLKKNPLFSYAVICVVYIIAIIAGIIIAKAMSGPAWVNLLVADVAATIIVFLFSSIFRNSSIYDPYWSVQPIIIVFVLAFGHAFSLLRFFMIFAITVWGVRLTANWALRFKSLRKEDWRYANIRKTSGPFFPVINFAGIHLFPTLIVYMCMLPVVEVFTNDYEFSLVSIPFFLTALGGVAMETYADYHMNLFKKDVADGYASGCCRYGLWKRSRHPNYLGEMIFWWSIYLMAVFSLPSRWYLFFAPVILTLMFAFVSIPMAEARLSNKGGYQRYKDMTRLLLPIPKRKKSERY